MHDVIQQGLETLARQDAVARTIAIVCAAALVYLLAATWVILLLRYRARLTVATAVRIGGLALLAYLAARVLGGLISDPRPYLVTHTQPLLAVGHDNGFPSDHTLLAAVLTASLWWVARRPLLLFALGTLLVGLGRLGVGAHHTLDVAGSIVIALGAALVMGVLPLPRGWARPLLPALRRVVAALWRPISQRDPLA